MAMMGRLACVSDQHKRLSQQFWVGVGEVLQKTFDTSLVVGTGALAFFWAWAPTL